MRLPSLFGLSSIPNTLLMSFGMIKVGSLFCSWSLSSSCRTPIFSFTLWFSGTCSSYDPAEKECVFFFKKGSNDLSFPYEYDVFHVCSLLRVKEAMLSLVSVMVIETEVVAVLPDAIPRRSWALTTTTYWLLVSRSRVFILQLITPGRDGDRFG